MTIETSIFEALKALVPAGDGTFKVFPDVAREGTAAPWITYQQVGGAALNFLEATPADKRNGRFQLSCWAGTRTEASDLGRHVEDALVAALGAFVLGAATAIYESDTKLYGTRQDFSIWF